MEKSIFEPSSGGIGIKLKTTKRRFIQTIIAMKNPSDGKKDKSKNLIMRPKKTARRMLAEGPARVTRADPHFLFLKLFGLKGTGLGQPIITTEAPKSAGRASKNGKIIEPKGSKCGKGFKVRRPATSAVLSP